MPELASDELRWRARAGGADRARVPLIVDAVVLDSKRRERGLVVILCAPAIAVREERRVRREQTALLLHLRPCPLRDADDTVAGVGLRAGRANLAARGVNVAGTECQGDRDLDPGASK